MTFLLDLRYALRGLLRARLATTALVLSLALGAGANAAVFGLVDALLVRAPAGVIEPARLVTLQTSQFNGAAIGPTSYPDYVSVRASATAFEGLAAVDDRILATVRVRDRLEPVRIAAVSEEFFALLGLGPSLGTLLGPGSGTEDIPSAVISHAFWATLDRDEAIVGETLAIEERRYTIAGIGPERFRGLQLDAPCDVWIRLDAPAGDGDRGDRRLALLGRLRRGVGLEQAQAELDAVAVSLAERYPDTNRGTVSLPDEPRRITVLRYSRLEPGRRRQMAMLSAVLLGTTTLVLLSACLNAGILLLTRATARRREVAVKVALGATTGRLVGQLLTESLLVAAIGGGLGLLFAAWTVGAFPAMFAPEHAALLDARGGGRSVAWTLAIVLGTGVACGVAPAVFARRSFDVQGLRDDAGGVTGAHRESSARAALVTTQVALSTLLLIATVLSGRALIRGLEPPAYAGLATRRTATASIDLPRDPVRRAEQAADLLRRAREFPGTLAAGWIASLPLGRTSRRVFRIEGSGRPIAESVEVDVNVVSPGAFRALGMRLIEGRLFDERDGALAPPVAVVNELMARLHFGGSAAGRQLHERQGTTLEVVGVVRTREYRTLQESARPTVYLPLSQTDVSQLHLVVVTEDEAETMREWLRALLREAGASATRIVPLSTHLSEALALERFVTAFEASCGLLALALAMVGVHGVMREAADRRTREIGLRVALGAGRAQIRWLVLGHGLRLTAGGVVIGLAAAVLAGRVARSLVFGVPSLDVPTAVVVAAGLTVAVGFAGVMPLRRALRISPLEALRHE